MIPESAVRAWQEASPLKLSKTQACQDLMLRRLMVEVGSHQYLGEFTALTGGTTLHHLMLPRQLRYSEDLDLLMRVPTGHDLSAFYNSWRRDIAPRMGLMTNSHTHTEYPKMHLSWKQSGVAMRITVDLARHPENVITGERATKRNIFLDNEWFSGTTEVYCIRPSDLAASKLSACSTRIKPRDLFDLQVMREPLDIRDTEIVERFIANYTPRGWNDGVARRIAESHNGKEFLEAANREMENGFLPRSFNVTDASNVYAHLAEKVAVEQRKRSADL